MRACSIKCRHKAMVLEFQDAVYAREALRENSEHYQLEDDEFNDIHPPVLFKDWLIGLKGRFTQHFG